MKHYYLNTSLENLIEEIDGVTYIEEWKFIQCFGGAYQISSFGRVKSMPRKITNNEGFYISKCKIIKCCIAGSGYISAGLRIKKRQKRRPVHVLVAKAFIPNPFKKKTVHHINDDKKDNMFKRLMWFTQSEQVNDARMKRINPQIGETHHWAKLTESQVIEILRSNLSASKLSKKYSVTRHMIRLIQRRKSWRHLDFS